MSSLEDAMQLSYELGKLRECDCGNSKVEGRRLPGGAPFYQVRCGGCGKVAKKRGTESAAVAVWNSGEVE